MPAPGGGAVQVNTYALELLAAAAPGLHALEARLSCYPEVAARLLRAEPPLTALRLRGLNVSASSNFAVPRLGPLFAALADTALQPTLTELALDYVHVRQPDVAAALVDCALARRLSSLKLFRGTPVPAEQVARLLTGGSLAELSFMDTGWTGDAFLDAQGAALVAAALRANTTLRKLTFPTRTSSTPMLARQSLCLVRWWGTQAYGASRSASKTSDLTRLHWVRCLLISWPPMRRR